MVPQGDFTPHGYLDNPYHSWKLNPSGVLRSLPPLGMGWHVPNLGSYVNNQFQYTAHLTIGLRIHDLVLVTPEDFRRHKCAIRSSLHTKNRFEYTCDIPTFGVTLTARYFLANEDALACVLNLSTTSQKPLPITCYLIHLHTHNPHTSRNWEHGLYALQDRAHGCALLGLASEGDAFVHGARAADSTSLTFDETGFMTTLGEVSEWARGADMTPPNITERRPDSGWQLRALALPCSLTLSGTSASTAQSPASVTLQLALARGVSQDQALLRWLAGMDQLDEVESRHRMEDETFWAQAPQLSGDWPDSWRRGFVYDLETLRMVIRRPMGVIPYHWDSMQIQAPRTVLAEAAMDALFLSYADPHLAAEVMLCHFESSPRPNLPCMREDGSYNMVADDGQICGTAPEWGFPLWCLDLLYRRSGDIDWLTRLYPGVADYLRWWLEYRSDAEGWLGYACSWESGQDVSTRFGSQQTGGSIIQHVRPVDLQASMAQGAGFLARWATLLMEAGVMLKEIDLVAEHETWRKVADEYTVKTRQMWQKGWFRDFDAFAREWSSEQDAMHLAPVFCGVADQGQIEKLRPALAQPPSNNPYWRPLSWPPIIMTVSEAARAARMPAEAAELAARFIDASYRSIDARTPDEYGNIPGVTRENRRLVERKFGVDYVNSGIEGYGWGAVSIHLLLRHLLGLREIEADRLVVAPMLPASLRRPGATYRVGPLPWGAHTLNVECRVKDARSFTMRLESATGQWQWDGAWGEEREIALS
jgi:hypothetical protein